MNYKFVSKSKEWKDRLAGYCNWRITFICAECGYHITDTIQGTEQDIQDYCKNPFNSVCDECRNKYANN